MSQTSEWHRRGTIEAESVRAIVAQSTGLAVAMSAVGIHVSRDRGQHFENSGLGVVGPLATDLAVGDGENPMIAIVGPAGLFVAPNGGAWLSAQPFPAGHGTAVAISNGELLVGSGSTGQIWVAGTSPLELSSRGLVGELVERFVAERGTRHVWAVAGGRLRRSDDEGRSWYPVDVAGGQPIVDVAAGERAHALAEDGGVWTWHEGDSWMPEPRLPEDSVATCIGESRDVGLLVGTRAGLLALAPGHATWTVVSEPVHVTALAIDAACVLLATASQGLWRSPDGGRAWERRELPRASLIVDLTVATTGRIVARTTDGLVALSDDGGRTWSDPMGPDPVSMAPDGTVRIFGTVGDGGESASELPFGWLAAAGHAAAHDGQSIALADGSGVWVSRDGGSSWTRSAPPGDPDHLVASLSVAGGSGEVMAVTRRPGETALWFVPHDGAWTVAAREPTEISHLAASPDQKRRYAALGASLLRPARIGARLFAREDPGIGDILDLAIGSVDSGLVACLGREAIAVSRDGGFLFEERFALPPDLATTAIAIDETASPACLLAVAIGGDVWSISL